jgi:hypothetical protein
MSTGNRLARITAYVAIAACKQRGMAHTAIVKMTLRKAQSIQEGGDSPFFSDVRCPANGIGIYGRVATRKYFAADCR